MLLADPDPMALAALSATLAPDRSIGPVVETQTPADAAAAAATGQFEVAIVSEWFPGRHGGVELARELHRIQPTLLIIMVAIPTRSHEVLPAIQAGVRGYLLKQRDMRRLPQIVRRAVDHGTGEFSTPLTDELLAELINHEPRFAPRPLTAREREVVELVARGLSNREIGEELNVSVATVKSHVHSAMRKTSVANRVQLARHGDDLETMLDPRIMGGETCRRSQSLSATADPQSPAGGGHRGRARPRPKRRSGAAWPVNASPPAA